MSADMLGQGKPENPIHKFFTNGFVQGVVVFVALAVAFSGKLDSKGTLVALLVAAAIGAIGIYTHYSNTTRQKTVATFSILIYGCALWAFYSYLTSRPTVTAGNTTIQQQDAKPSEAKPEGKKQDKKEQDAKKAAPKPKVDKPNSDIKTGNIEQGACSNLAIGSSGSQTVNCGPPDLVMSDAQRSQVTDYLTQESKVKISPLKVHIFVDGPTASTQKVGDQLRKALSEAGADVDKDEGMLIAAQGDPIYPGISFDNVTSANQEKANAIGLALLKAKVLEKPAHALQGKRADGGIDIVIRKP
jgi:hypothetical protein